MRLSSLSCSLLVAATLLASACTDDPMAIPASADAGPDASPGPAPEAVDFPSTGNNSARAETPFGSGATENQALVKRVDFESTDPSGSLHAGPVFVSRSATFSTYVNTFVRVENQGATRRCFVSIPAMQLRDAAGATIATDSVSYVQGSVGASSVYTDTCLAPGESGYFVGILEAPYTKVASLVFSIDGGDEGFGDPAMRVVPEDITGSVDFVDASAHNLGPVAAELTFNLWIGYDAAHQPLHFGYLDPCDAQASMTVAPGQVLPLCSSDYFDGSGQAIQTWLGYGLSSAAKSAAGPNARALEEVRAARARLHDRYLAARARLF
jgi:hypothetical protein